MTTNYPIQRPPSEQLVDLHVYLLPREVWNEKNSSAYNESFSEAVSAGFVRVSRNQTVSDLRMVIEEQLGPDTLPPNYVFLRSVGRRMTQVKPKQELELKCKAFLPPEAWAPEIVVLEPQKDSRGFQTYQSYPGYSPRHDTTQPISGIPTHFPQIANHDRMAPPTDGVSQHITHPKLVPGDSPTIHPASIPASIQARLGQKLPLPSSHHPNPHPNPPLNPPLLPYPTHAQNANLANNALDSAQLSSNDYQVAANQDNTRGKDNPNTSANNSASFNIVQPLPEIAHHSPNVLVVKSQSGSHLRHPMDEKAEKSHPISSYPLDPTNTGFNSDDDTNHVADVASNTNKRTTNVSLGEDVIQDTTPTTSITTGLHHTNNNLYHHHKNIHQSDSRRLSNNDSNSVPFPAPLSATPPDTPTSDTPSPSGHSPMVQQQQQQQGYKGDPLHNMVGIPGKSGRPDAYTNNTNEDSGIAEPTPDDEDPAYERRKSDIDDQYYNQLDPSQTHDEPLQHGERRWDQSDRYQEEEIEDERRRQAEIQQREEEKRKEEERRNAERQKEEERRKVERQREEERREHKRKLEQKRQEDAKEQRQREKQKKLEEERRKEEEKRKEEMARKEEEERLLEEEQQQSIADRAGVTDFDGAVPLDEGDDDYDDAAMAMETSQALDNHGYFVNDEQMRRRAEDELRDYQPQSTWKMDEEGGRETGHLAHPSSRIRSREDTEMELASQQAVQDGLKRVHLTPELHRKAKIGKIRDSSVTDEEDVYETDPEMAGLLEQLQIARQERMKKEKERENVIKRAKDFQTKTYERRNRSRDYWKKRYYDEKKKTAPLEDQGNRIRNQLEVMHRKLLSHIEGKKKGVSVKGPPSKKNDHKINILKMQHELDELRRKVDNSRMKLTSEIKLRNQAEEEVRGLKSEVTQRKINMTLIRNQKLAALKTGENKLLSKTPIPALGQGPMSMSAKR